MVIDDWMSVVPVIGERARRRIRCRGSYGDRQDAVGPARDREVAADKLVRVVVEIVLDGDLVEPLVRVRRAEVGEEAHLVVQAVDVEDLVIGIGIDLPRRHLGMHARRAPVPAGGAGALLVEGPAADLVAPAHDLPLQVRHHPDDVVDVQRHVDLVISVAPRRREDPARVRDRIVRHEREQVPVIHHGVRVDRGVVDPGVLVVVEPVVRERIAQAIVVEPGQPLGVGVEALEVGLGPEVPRPVVLLVLQIAQGLLIEPRLVQPLVIFFQEVAVGDVGDFELEPEVLELVLVVVGEEPLHVPRVEPAADVLERGHVGSLISLLAGSRGPVGDDRPDPSRARRCRCP